MMFELKISLLNLLILFVALCVPASLVYAKALYRLINFILDLIYE